MKLWLTWALMVLSLAACQPSDQKVKSVRERVLAGETVTFSTAGYSLCGPGPGWTDMRVNDLDERDRVILKKQSSMLNPGHATCYRIGDTIDLSVFNRQVNGGGRVRIDSLALSLFDKLRNSQLQGEFFASSDNFTKYKEALKFRLKPDQEGIVTTVNFTYLSGSAADEASIRQKDSEQSAGDGYEETSKDGDFLPSSKCSKKYTYLSVPEDQKALFLDGSLRSWYILSDRTCLAQGQSADLSPGKDAPPLATVQITKVKKFRVRSLDAKYFSLGKNVDFKVLADRIAHDNTKNSEWILVVDFTIPSSGAQP